MATDHQRRGAAADARTGCRDGAADAITGRVDPVYAGARVWAFETVSDRRTAAAIDTSGSFAFDSPFRDATAHTPVQVRTPAYTITRPLGELVAGHLTADGSLDGDGR